MKPLQLIMQQGVVRRFVVDQFDEKAIFLCQFCGGQTCKQEDYRTNTKLPNAVQGLHSNWITDNILAMQRPSERLIKEFNLYTKFKQQNIRTVLNLQQPGEHPYCGDGIIPTVGFSYVPQNFYHNGIRCFSESWEDMTSTTFTHMMRIMNVFQSSLRDGGKISVHCHAGRGRTLLVICSWLIYHNRISAVDVIKLAVEKREGVLTSGSQRQFLHYFQKELAARWISFGPSLDHRSFTEFSEWQSVSLLNKQKKRLYSTPVAHFRIMRELKHIVNQDGLRTLQAFLSLNSQNFDETHEHLLEKYKKEFNIIYFKGIKEEKDPKVLIELLFDFYQELPCTLLTAISVDCLREEFQHQNQQKSRLKALMSPPVVHSFGIATIAVILDFSNFIKTLQKIDAKILQLPQVLESGPQNKQKQDSVQQTSKIRNKIDEALFMRLSLLLFSKRKFFKQIFSGAHLRQSKIYKFGGKVRKAVGPQVGFLCDFLIELAKELPEDWQQLERIIFKIRQVQSNLFQLLREGQHRSLSGPHKQKLYEQARLNR